MGGRPEGEDQKTGISLFGGKSYEALEEKYDKHTFTLSEDPPHTLINKALWDLPTEGTRDYNLAIKPDNQMHMPPKNNVYLLFIIAKEDNCPYHNFAIGFRVKDLRKVGTSMMSTYNYLSPWPGDVHGPEIIKGWGFTTAIQTTRNRCENILDSFYRVFTDMADISTRFISSFERWNESIGNVIFKVDSAYSNFVLNTPTQREADAALTQQVKTDIQKRYDEATPADRKRSIQEAREILRRDAQRRVRGTHPYWAARALESI